ncbi:MAG: dTDP-4-dehydrorhamnose reductase, partial [Planctomycetota bacterium]
MRVFITGWDGLCGRALRRVLASRGGFQVSGGDLPELDVRRPRSLQHRLLEASPDVVVHLAAWTDVDGCERDAPAAFLSNGRAAGHVADAARACGASLLHVSTDYVFDGTASRPYRETDRVRPISVYGHSKLQGEIEVRNRMPAGRWSIVRGQSLYGTARKSFPDAILRLSATKSEIPVVVDQVVSPTWAHDFASSLAALLEVRATGLYHASSGGSCTWNTFAAALLEEAGIHDVRITETTAEAFGRPAPRPAWSVFDCGKLERTTGHRQRSWRDQLRNYLRETGR